MSENRKKPPVAVAVPVAYELHCRKPDCRETIPSPGGSLFWTASEVYNARSRRIICPVCESPHSAPTGLR